MCHVGQSSTSEASDQSDIKMNSKNELLTNIKT
jgi:hypothetical protein